MAPIAFIGSAAEMIERVVAVLEKEPRVQIAERRADYVRAVFVSLVFRFRDDVEFYADQQTQLLHFRSASRLGYSDLGANRKRMERLAERLSNRSPE